MRCSTGSQCSVWSSELTSDRRGACRTIRAALFWTRWIIKLYSLAHSWTITCSFLLCTRKSYNHKMTDLLCNVCSTFYLPTDASKPDYLFPDSHAVINKRRTSTAEACLNIVGVLSVTSVRLQCPIRLMYHRSNIICRDRSLEPEKTKGEVGPAASKSDYADSYQARRGLPCPQNEFSAHPPAIITKLRLSAHKKDIKTCSAAIITSGNTITQDPKTAFLNYYSTY